MKLFPNNFLIGVCPSALLHVVNSEVPLFNSHQRRAAIAEHQLVVHVLSMLEDGRRCKIERLSDNRCARRVLVTERLTRYGGELL